MHRKITVICLFLIPLLLELPSAALRAQENDSGLAIQVAAGFDGLYKPDRWLPIRITVANSGPSLSGELRVLTGFDPAAPQVAYSAPITLPTQSNKAQMLYIFPSLIAGRLTVELVDDNGRLRQSAISNSLRPLTHGELLYAIVSPEATEFTFLETLPTARETAVALLALADLPDLPVAWSGLDVLVVNDTDTARLTAAQQAALKGWLNAGGQLVVAGGPGWQKTTAALADYLPVSVNDSQSMADLPDLAAQTGLPFRDAGPYVVAISQLRSGELLYHQAGLPLLARRSWGRGTAYFLALDPTLAPLVDWNGSLQLWADMADTLPMPQPWGLGVQNIYAATTAVASLPSLVLPSFASLFIFLLLYLLIVGPANYLVLKRINQRELAWVTIPAIILLFSTGTYIWGFQIKGNNVILNQMSVVYGSIDSDSAQVQTLIGLYSPRRAVYNLLLPGDTAVRPVSDGYNGVLSRFDAISRENELTITNLRTDVGSIETFLADAYRPLPDITAQAALALNSGRLQLGMSLQNRSDIELTDAVLLFNDIVIPVGTLGAGRSQNLTQDLGGSSPGSTPVFAPGPAFYSPLSSQPEQILGTVDYYNDPEAFPRWQLLQALDASNGRLPTFADNTVTLLAWSTQPQIDLTLDHPNVERLFTTLYLLDIPISQNTLQGLNVSVPLRLLNWSVLSASGIFEPTIQNLYLNGGSVDFEFRPRADFAALQVTGLDVVLGTPNPGANPAAPDVSLWNWQTDSWEELTAVVWGTTAVANPTPYIGPDNAVRLRLVDTTLLGADIQEIYPLLTGNME